MKKPTRAHHFIFNHFKSEFTQLVYEEPIKSSIKIPEMQWLFKCSDGRDYYMWKDPINMPIKRNIEFVGVFSQWLLKFQLTEIEGMFNAMDAGMKETKPDIGLVLFCIEEFKNRKESKTFFHPELFYHMMSICIVNIDENIEQLTNEWKRTKMELFEKDFENGLSDAVFNSPLIKFIPQIANMDDYLQAFMDNSKVELMALQQTLTYATDGRNKG